MPHVPDRAAVTPRERAAAALQAWAGDAVGLIAHLQGAPMDDWAFHPNTRALWDEMGTLRLAHALACREVAEWRQRAEDTEGRAMSYLVQRDMARALAARLQAREVELLRRLGEAPSASQGPTP